MDMVLGLGQRRSRCTAMSGEAGVSLIEALISVGLLFIVAAGILPLFSRSIVNNAIGNDANRSANFSRSSAERMLAQPFDSALLTVPDGAQQLEVVEQWFTARVAGNDDQPASEGAWFQASPADNRPTDRLLPAQWFRTSTVRQFGVGQWRQAELLADADAYSGGTHQDFLQLKVVDIQVTGVASQSAPGLANILGSQRPMRVRVMKAF